MKKGVEMFIRAQEKEFEKAYAEIKKGKKTGHWMWYIFPQLNGLGSSPMAVAFGIEDVQHAKLYLSTPVLRENLIKICRALLEHADKDILDIMQFPDNLKLRSSMTLFELADSEIKEFGQILDTFFEGVRDNKTLFMLNLLTEDEVTKMLAESQEHYYN